MINRYFFREQKHYYFDDYNDLFKNNDILSEFKNLDVVKYTEVDFKFEYVGIIIFEDNMIFCYPKYIPEKNVVDDEFKEIIEVIKTFDKQRNSLLYQYDEFENYSYNLISLMIFFLEDYYENGIYTKTQNILEINGNGEIDWNRTVNQEYPIIQNGKPYYINLQTRYHQNDLENYFRVLHKRIITHCSIKLNEYDLLDLFDLNSVELSQKSSFDDFGEIEFIKSQIQKELNIEFNTHKRILLNAMYSFFSNNKSSKEKFLALYGSNEYYYIWESMCSEIFNDNFDDTLGDLFKDKLNNNFSKNTQLKNVINNPVYHNGDISEDFSRLIPDLVIFNENNNQLIILDGKYRNVYKNKHIEDILSLYDVNKQFLYQLAYYDLIHLQNIKCVKNALLFPTYNNEVIYGGYIESDMFSNIKLNKIQIILLPAREVTQCYLEERKKPISWLELKDI